MVMSNVRQLAVQKGWNPGDDFLIQGTLADCPVTLVDGEGFVAVIFAMPGLEKNTEDWERLSLAVEEAGVVRMRSMDAIDGFFSLRLPRSVFSSPSAGKLDILMNIVVEKAEELGLIHPGTCMVCGEATEEDEEAKATLFGLACSVHDACKAERGDTRPIYPIHLQYEDQGLDPYQKLKAK